MLVILLCHTCHHGACRHGVVLVTMVVILVLVTRWVVLVFVTMIVILVLVT